MSDRVLRMEIGVWAGAVVLAFGAAWPADAAELAVRSEVPAILATPLASLPKGPDAAAHDSCGNRIIEPQTAAGRHVAERGWGVVSEIALGSFQLVSFGGAFAAGTSGSCAIHEGNIGVFDGTALKLLLYTARKTDETIGLLEAKEGGEVRLWSGEYLRAPVADLALVGDELVIRPVSSAETFCAGKASVPNIYGAPITEARERLQAAGWQPVPQPEAEGGYGQQPGLHEAGITEAVDCSGTGFGFCNYEYAQDGRGTLSVTTVGELTEDSAPIVAFYDVACQ